MDVMECLYCYKTLDPLIGHYCVSGWWYPGLEKENITNKAVAEEFGILKRRPTDGAWVQIHEATSVLNDIVNINAEFSHDNYLSNQVIYGNNQPTYSNQEQATGCVSNHLMAMDSEQGHMGEWAIDGLNEEVILNELGASDFNMTIGTDFGCRELASNNDALTSMVCQSALDEDNLSIPTILNSSNTMPDFSTVSGSINSMTMHKFPILDAFEDVQTQIKIQSEHLKSINYLEKGSHCYDISSIIDDPSVINEDRGRENNALIMRNQPESEMAVDSNRLSDLYSQISKYGRNTQEILKKEELDCFLKSVFIGDELSSHLVFSNIPIHGPPERSGSINDQVGRSRTNAEMMRHKCTDAPTEDKIGFNDMSFVTVTEESAKTGISYTQRSDPFENCSVDATHALAGPSISHFNEHFNFVNLKEIQSNSNVNCHSLHRKKYLKKDMFVQTRIKQHKCNVCQKSFRRKGHLQEHILTHTGKKPFQCEVCAKLFKQKQHLRMHVLIHMGNKPFHCEVCGKSFGRKEHLRTHALTHTGNSPFKCEVCGKSFKQKEHLRRHALTHTCDKSFECEVCGKSFGRKDHWRRHVIIHKGDKPHELHERK